MKALETLWNYLVNDKIEEADKIYEQIVVEQKKKDELLKAYRDLNELINDYELTNVTVAKQQRYIEELEIELE